jgi:hypothetical protein
MRKTNKRPDNFGIDLRVPAYSRNYQEHTGALMLRPLNFGEFGKSDLIPQAIIGKPISYFANQGFQVVHDNDALDVFEGVALLLDGLPFALIHHRGNPYNETTVYLTRDFGHDVDRITTSIRHILEALNLPFESLIWERKNNPDF